MDALNLLERGLAQRESAGAPMLVPAGAKTDRQIEDEMRQWWSSILSSSEAARLDECRRLWRRGLQLARSRERWKEAAGCFTASQALLDAVDTTERTRHAAQTYLSSAAGFLAYVRGEWSIAEQHMRRALISDDVLQQKYGLSIIHLHKIHAIENLARIERRRGNLGRATALYGDLVYYLAGLKDKLDCLGEWGWKTLLLPIGNLNLKLRWITGDIAQTIAGLDPHMAADLFRFCIALTDRNPDETVVDPIVFSWYRAKKAFLENKIEELVRYSQPIIDVGPKYECRIWSSTTLDLLTVGNADGALIHEFRKIYRGYRFLSSNVAIHLDWLEYMYDKNHADFLCSSAAAQVASVP